jgi:hypothetical protein
MCRRENCPFSNLKIYSNKLIAFLETLQILEQEWQKSPALGPGKQTAKTVFSLEKWKENLPNYQCLPLLTVLPLNYFMGCTNLDFGDDASDDHLEAGAEGAVDEEIHRGVHHEQQVAETEQGTCYRKVHCVD